MPEGMCIHQVPPRMEIEELEGGGCACAQHPDDSQSCMWLVVEITDAPDQPDQAKDAKAAAKEDHVPAIIKRDHIHVVQVIDEKTGKRQCGKKLGSGSDELKVSDDGHVEAEEDGGHCGEVVRPLSPPDIAGVEEHC